MTNPLPTTSSAIKPGAVIRSGAESYEIISVLGRGGMGVVYKAKQLTLQRTVALKMLAKDSELSETLVQRFKTEARLCATLDHPNIIRVYSLGQTDDGELFLAMEYIEGKTLADVLQETGSLSSERFTKYFDQVLSALQVLHKQGLVHRDIKPANLMVTTDDTIKLMDFGIAKDIDPTNRPQQALTQTGALIGSPWYMSPEQCRGEKLDARSDLYSLGCVMYESATGKPVFAGDNALEVMYKHLHDQLTTTGALDIPHHGPLIMKAMEKQPADRFGDAEEMRQTLALTQLVNSPSARRRVAAPPSRLRLLIGITAVLCVGLSGYVAFQPASEQQQQQHNRLTSADITRTLKEATIALDTANSSTDRVKGEQSRKLAKELFDKAFRNKELLDKASQSYAQLQWLRLSDDTENARQVWQDLRQKTPPAKLPAFDCEYETWLFRHKHYPEAMEFTEGTLTRDLRAFDSPETKISTDAQIAGRKAEIMIEQGQEAKAGSLLVPLASHAESLQSNGYVAALQRYLVWLRETGQIEKAAELAKQMLPAADSYSTANPTQFLDSQALRVNTSANYAFLLSYLASKSKFSEFDSWFSRAIKYSDVPNPAWIYLAQTHRECSIRYANENRIPEAVGEIQKARECWMHEDRSDMRSAGIVDTYQVEFWWQMQMNRPDLALITVDQALADPNAQASEAAHCYEVACKGKTLVILHRAQEAEDLLAALLKHQTEIDLQNDLATLMTYSTLAYAQAHAGHDAAAAQTYKQLFQLAKDPKFRAVNPPLLKEAETQYKQFRSGALHG